MNTLDSYGLIQVSGSLKSQTDLKRRYFQPQREVELEHPLWLMLLP